MDQLPTNININNSKRYYCYSCRTEVLVTPNFSCMQCAGGFVEEIAAGPAPNMPRLLRMFRRTTPNIPTEYAGCAPCSLVGRNNSGNSGNIAYLDDSFASTSSAVYANLNSNINDNANNNRANVGASGTANASGSGNASASNTEVPPSISERTDNFRGAIMNVLMDVLDLLGSVHNNHNATSESNASATNDPPNTSRRGAFTDNVRSRLRDLVASRYSSTDNRDPNNQNALNAFFDFAFGSTGGGLNANFNLGNQTFVMGDAQNNARRDEDLANMLMNTINRLLPTVSRPISNDKLQLIPKVEVTAEDLANQDMCAICWDEFQLQESVRKLPCTHLFHETCVFPWLKLHQTCPLCRNCLNDDHGYGGFGMEASFSGDSSETTETSSIEMTTFSSDDSIDPEVTNEVRN